MDKYLLLQAKCWDRKRSIDVTIPGHCGWVILKVIANKDIANIALEYLNCAYSIINMCITSNCAKN